MQTTTHYGLEQPQANDTVDIVGLETTNTNIIDSQLYAIVQAIFGSQSVVLSGGVATKDANTVTQLDVTAATVYCGTGQAWLFGASVAGQFTTATPSATYYLDYNTDGTSSWGTAHSTKAGYVTLAQITTDASGNILAVTDERPLTVQAFGAAVLQATKFKGDGSQLTNVPAPANATTNSVGLVEVSAAPTSGSPVAVSTSDTTYTAPNASKLGGNAPSTAATANTVALRDASGNLTANTFNGSLNGTANYANNAYYATAAGELDDYNGGHTIKGTWNGSELEFEVDSAANVQVALANNANYATTAGTSSNANELGGQSPGYYAVASSSMSVKSGGSKVQSGSSSISSPGVGTCVVTFSSAFASSPVVVCSGSYESDQYVLNPYNISSTGFSILIPYSTVIAEWIAVGN